MKMCIKMFESLTDTAVFTFGRLNPPTTGHEKLIQAVINTAKQNGADHYIFLSQTHKSPKDPLPWSEKVQYAKAIFKGVNISTDQSIKTPFQALEHLGKKYKNVIMVVGDDRVAEFSNSMSKYTEQWGIENFQVISAGERDPDANDVSGMSASKMRQYAVDSDLESFKTGIPDTVSDKTKESLYNRVREELGVTESISIFNINLSELFLKKGIPSRDREIHVPISDDTISKIKDIVSDMLSKDKDYISILRRIDYEYGPDAKSHAKRILVGFINDGAI